MKQLTFAIPISKTVALADLERRCQTWGLPDYAYRMLVRWYEAGWDDGIVEFDRHELARALGIASSQLDDAIDLFQDLQLVRVRRGLAHEVAELLALSLSQRGGSPSLGWWQVYLLEMEEYDD